MKTRTLHSILTLLVVVLMAALPVAAEDSYTYDLEVGYQWVDVVGNEDMYLSQVDQEDGFVLGLLNVVSLKPEGEVYDRLRVNASGFGGEPSGRLMFDMGRGDLYNVTFAYLTSKHSSILPGHANPFMAEGIVPGQHVFHRDQDSFHLQLELLPGRMFTPILGYRWTRFEGPKHTTYHVGQDEFQITSDLEETEDEYYVGVAFNSGTWHGVLTQGWREFEGEEASHLEGDHGFGNNHNEVLGVDVHMDDFHRTTRTESDTPVTNFRLGGRLGERLELRAMYVRADAEAETASTEMLSGSLVSYRINRFFTGLDDSVASETESPSWRGQLDMSLDFGELVTADIAFGKRKRTLDGWAMLSTVYLDTLNFSGYDPRDITRLTEVRTSSEREESAIDLRLDFGGSHPVRFWVEGSFLNQDLTVSEDMAQIILPLGQEGQYDREITRYGIGALVSVGDGRVSVDWQSEDADNIVMRTDFTNRTRMRLRADFPLGEMFDFGGTYEVIGADNFGSGVNYQASTDHLSVDLTVRPMDPLSLVFIWDTYETESSMDVRVPMDWSVMRSVSLDDGELLEGRVDLGLDRVDISAGFTRLENTGSMSFRLDRYFGRVGVDVTDHIGFVVELENHDYQEDLFSAADFDADRYAILVRLHH